MPRKLTVAIAAGLVALPAAAALRRKATANASLAPLLRSGAGARNAELARMGGRIGVATAANRARRVFTTSAEGRQALDDELQLKTAEQVAATLGEMKGALM